MSLAIKKKNFLSGSEERGFAKNVRENILLLKCNVVHLTEDDRSKSTYVRLSLMHLSPVTTRNESCKSLILHC